jgi:Ca2+-binding EF-hand superfamily protein
MSDFVQRNKEIVIEKLDKSNTWVITKIRQCMEIRGFFKNLVGISRMFKDLDSDGTMELDFKEFKRGLAHYCGLDLNYDEAKMAFDLFDSNGDNKVSLDEFLFAVLPPLSSNRLKYVDASYKSFNPTIKEGHFEPTINVEDIYNRIDMTHHPQVLRGIKTKTEMFRDFFVAFESDVGAEVDFREFLQYSTTLSVHTVTDYEFGHMMTNMFNVPDEYIEQMLREHRNEQKKIQQLELLKNAKPIGQEVADQLWSSNHNLANQQNYTGAAGRLKRQMRQ